MIYFLRNILIRRKKSLVKILANGKISKSINLKVDKFSKNALKAVTDVKGTISNIELKSKVSSAKKKREEKEK